MPGVQGFSAYGPALASLPATSQQVAGAAKMTAKGAGELMRRLWALGLVHPGGVVGRSDLKAGGAAKTVWHLGPGPAVSQRVSKKRPYAQHIVLASIVRALEAGCTTKELAEEVGFSVVMAQMRVKQLRESGMVHVAEWAQDACGRAVARYEWGPGKDAPKPVRLTPMERWWRRVERTQAMTLHRAWGPL